MVIIKIAVDGVCHTIPAFLVSSVTNVSDIEEHEKLGYTHVYAHNDSEICISEEVRISEKTLMTPADIRKIFPNVYVVKYELMTQNSEAEFSYSYDEHGEYYVTNKFLRDMPEYPFDREQLTTAFKEIIGSCEAEEKLYDIVYSGNEFDHVGDFRIWTEEEETYILHLPSGTIVGWYKFTHIGRCNFCNKPDMTIDDLRDFFMLLRNQLMGEPDVPRDIHPQVKVTEVDKSEVEKTLTKADIEKTVTRLTINSIYGAHGLDPTSMYPMPPKSVDMENAWNVVKQWAKEHFHFSETNHIKCTVTSKSGKDNVWLIRHHDFIQLMGDTGDEIFIGYMRAEYSHKDEYGRQTCIQDPNIRFTNPIIDEFYQDFFANGPMREEYDLYEEYDFYKKTGGGW